MKMLIGFAVAMSFGFSAGIASGQNCPNGKCPNTYSSNYSYYSNAPIEANVSGTKEMTATEKEIVEIEKKALEKWYAGDPTPYIDNMSGDIAYFEPILDKRLDGKQSLSKMFEALRGKVHADKFDMLNTRVQLAGDSAILSFNLIAIEDGVPYRWNCTEIFAKGADSRWKLIHSHWSQTKPPRS